MDPVHFLTFASDAEILSLWGLGFLVLAGVALVADRRRVKRDTIEQVGMIPWTGLFLTTMAIGVGLLTYGMVGIITG